MRADDGPIVGNIAYSFDEAQVKRALSSIGPLKEFFVPKDKETNRPSGFAFCAYENIDDAIIAVNSLDQLQIDGRTIKVDHGKDSAMTDKDLGGQRINVSTKKDIESALSKKLTISELYDVVSEMKLLIQRDREHAMKLLESKPVLAQALLTAQIMLGMAQVANEPSGAPGSASMAEQEANEEESQEALIARVAGLTAEEISVLDPDQREQVMEIRKRLGIQ
mmetsp:Transcript_623/g.1187  ORF Transcript_623/g.1187 Transcript_623/m.1187 type:complete len:222 (+) Transcript_623:94-759(+)